MAEAAEGAICSRPGCDEPGTSLCGSCRLVKYCCRICQVEDWPRHKEVDCQGHMRKIGMAHLQKARGFNRDDNWVQLLRYSELALVKLKQLKDRPIEAIDDALRYKFNALNFMDRNREALECATERYCLYLTKHTHPPAIEASFDLIESCLHNARTTWETITLSRDSHIPDGERQRFTARGAYYLALAMLALAKNGDIPPEANQVAGQEAIGLARRALEIHTQLNGLENGEVANAMRLLAQALDYFNDGDDFVEEILRLYEQSTAITARVEGSLSINVATGEQNWGSAYCKIVIRAHSANDLDRELANLELALPHYREAARIFRAIYLTDRADQAVQNAVRVEEALQRCTIAIAAVAATNG